MIGENLSNIKEEIPFEKFYEVPYRWKQQTQTVTLPGSRPMNQGL